MATDVTGTLELQDGESTSGNPGERMPIRFALDRQIGLETGMRFALREGKCTVGAGVVTAIR